MVSLAAPQPAFRIKTATTAPAQPSMLRWAKCPARVPANTAEVATTSERESAAVAAMAAEPSFFPNTRLKWPSTASPGWKPPKWPPTPGRKSTASGRRIFPMEVLPSSSPTRRIIRLTSSPARYSARPWPKGCPSSAFCPASLKPTRVTTDEPASDRLLKASAVMAMEPVTTPAKNLPADSSRLSTIPTAPDRTPYFSRTAGSVTLSQSWMKSRTSRLIMLSPPKIGFFLLSHARPPSSRRGFPPKQTVFLPLLVSTGTK